MAGTRTLNERQRKAMHEGLLLAYASMQKYFVTPGKSKEPLWKDESGFPKSQWLLWLFAPGQPEAGFTHESETEVLVDDRAAKYFYVTYLPRYLGGGTFYLTGLRDSNGDMFDGESTYWLNVPEDTPAKVFWSVIVYSMGTKNFVRGVARVGLSSRNADTMQVNEDGSYDVYFGPKPPEGKASNWIETGEKFFLLFRLYEPESKDFYKTWMLSATSRGSTRATASWPVRLKFLAELHSDALRGVLCREERDASLSASESLTIPVFSLLCSAKPK
jgi:hypothetical protein